MGNTPAETFRFIDVSGLPGAHGDPAPDGQNAFRDGWSQGAGTGGGKAPMDLADILALAEKNAAKYYAPRPTPELGVPVMSATGAVVAGMRESPLGWTGDEFVAETMFGRGGGSPGLRKWLAPADDRGSGLFEEDMSPGVEGLAEGVALHRAHVSRVHTLSLDGDETRWEESWSPDNVGTLFPVAGLYDRLGYRTRTHRRLLRMGTMIGRELGILGNDESESTPMSEFDDLDARFPTGGLVRDFGLDARSPAPYPGTRTGELGLGEPEGMLYPDAESDAESGGRGESESDSWAATLDCTQPAAAWLGQLARWLSRGNGVALVRPRTSIVSDAPLSYGPGAGFGDPKGIAVSCGSFEASGTTGAESGWYKITDEVEEGGQDGVDFPFKTTTVTYRTASSDRRFTSCTEYDDGPRGAAPGFTTRIGGMSEAQLAGLEARMHCDVRMVQEERRYSATYSGSTAEVVGDGEGHNKWDIVSEWSGNTDFAFSSLSKSSSGISWSGTDGPFTVAFARGRGGVATRYGYGHTRCTYCIGETDTKTRDFSNRQTSYPANYSVPLSEQVADDNGARGSRRHEFSYSVQNSCRPDDDALQESESWDSWFDSGSGTGFEESSWTFRDESWPAIWSDFDDSDSGSWWSDSWGWGMDSDSDSLWAGFDWGTADGMAGRWPIRHLVGPGGAWGGHMDDHGLVLVSYRVSWSFGTARSTSTGVVARNPYNVVGPYFRTVGSSGDSFSELGSGIVVVPYMWRWNEDLQCGTFPHPALDSRFIRSLIEPLGATTNLMWRDLTKKRDLPAVEPGDRTISDGSLGLHENPDVDVDDLDIGTESYSSRAEVVGGSGKGDVFARSDASVEVVGMVVFGHLRQWPA